MVSLSMTPPRKDVLGVISSELKPVREHLDKILVHAPSEFDEKWQGDIESFFPRIIRYAASGVRGRTIKRNDVEKALKSMIQDVASEAVKTYRMDDFLKMKKVAPQDSVEEVAYEKLVPALLGKVSEITDVILEGNEREGKKKVAKILVDTCLVCRQGINN